jgi:tetratricopeptide (TPR) repeat protein
MKQTSRTAPESGRMFRIHPLVQVWARESFCEGKFVFLAHDPQRLAALRRDGARNAICTVGCGLKAHYNTRESYDWIYEQKNMAHLQLCNKYILEYKIGEDSVMDETLASALRQFGGFKYYWGDYPPAADLLNRSITLYEKLLPETPRVEFDLLLAMQLLIDMRIRNRQLFGSFEETGVLVDKMVRRHKALLPEADSNVLWSEELQAEYFHKLGDLDRSLELFRTCIGKTLETLPPSHPVLGSTMNNLASLYEKLGENDKALELYDRSLELSKQYKGGYHLGTLIKFWNIALLKGSIGDYCGACECFRAAAEGYEVIYGLAHADTLKSLQELWKMHIRLGQVEDAQKVMEKISKGKKASSGGI